MKLSVIREMMNHKMTGYLLNLCAVPYNLLTGAKLD